MNVDDLTQALIAAHRTGARIDPGLPDLSRADILSVQRGVSAALGAACGFKIGASPDGPPIFAPIAARYQVTAGGDVAVRDRLGIELEIGFALIRPLPFAGLPESPQDYFRPHAVLELVDTRLGGAAADHAMLKFADNQINAGLVVGEGLPAWDGADFSTVAARLTAGDRVVLDGDATVPGGSALSNLDLLLTHLGDHCGGLQPGQIVITGSLCGLPWFTSGTAMKGWIAGLGDVAVNLR